ncbi:response regulator [Streptacidiphilus albus]|uniref:response regulator n=1 Tax=Streptacidiphilus albus TaxID=105425 RepID=UPI00054C5C24|nr:response regulator transcription factor [Streptacidiphilus albus]
MSPAQGVPEDVPEAAAPIRVLVADDQWVVRDGLVLLLGIMDGIEVVGTARDGAEAVHLAERLRPDIVLMDLGMPVLDGTEATAMLRERLPDCSVLVLTTYVDEESIFPALRAGARGYLTKDTSSEDVEAALRSVSAGRVWLDPVVQERLVCALSSVTPPTPSRAGAALPDGLTPREAEVLGLIAEGLSNAEICDRLNISHATVKTHINRIFTKIGAHDRSQAVRYAFCNGFVQRS